MATGRRVQKQPAFVLARHPFSESSLIIDAYSRDHGRVPVLAKGARRLKSPHRGLLQAFTPVLLDWSGRRELVTLTRAEPAGRPVRLGGRALMCGFYANELLLRFLHRGDPHEALFDAYAGLIADLDDGADPEWSLRVFETVLLRDAGYGLVLDREVVGRREIEENGDYRYIIGRGPVLADGEGFGGTPVRGETLIALRGRGFPGALARREAKRLTRALLGELLEGRGLRSRAVFVQMYGREGPD